jgi:peptide/nickel transport system ATP-binding protein
MSAASPLLSVENLTVRFGRERRALGVVDEASFAVAPGETVCLVGESGCGKTVTALSILRLEEHRGGHIAGGGIVFGGRNLVGLPAAELEGVRGKRIAMVFQEPMTAFDPVFTIGAQIVETILCHERISRTEAWERAVALLDRVHIPDARLRMKQIPHELSGGMRQRAMIAMALACKPDLLIADEPTTALDVTIQAQILALLKELQREYGMAILLITHDLGVAAEMADRGVVMYAGRVVEQGPVEELFANPEHPYTLGLLRSAIEPDGPRGARLAAIVGSMPRPDELPTGCRFHPRCPSATERCRDDVPALQRRGTRQLACWHPIASDTHARESLGPAGASLSGEPSAAAATTDESLPLVEVVGLRKHFDARGGFFAKRGTGRRVHAIDGVSLKIRQGETFGLVGESGCGKSTLGRILLQLETPSAGEVRFEGRAVASLRGSERQRVRREMQMVFQDPYGSIDPRWPVGDVIAEPIVSQECVPAPALRARVEELLQLVGLDASARTRFPHEFSGGQRQRIGIARALALRPKFLVADEAVSALDLSVQAQIINLLGDLRDRLGLTCLFIGHGLNVVRHLSDRIGVMYLGRLVEVAPADDLFRRPAHHYTRALISSIPSANPRRRLELVAPIGELPSPTAPPPGCHFHPRCPAATARCSAEAPELKEAEPGRFVACHHPH